MSHTATIHIRVVAVLERRNMPVVLASIYHYTFQIQTKLRNVNVQQPVLLQRLAINKQLNTNIIQNENKNIKKDVHKLKR